MRIALEVLTTVLVGIVMALSLAHALELPGKMRLTREQYLAVQPIYYPGFTIGGAAEPAAMIALIALLASTPPAATSFWLVAVALAALLVVQLIFWAMTQPVNRYWLQHQKVGKAAEQFFGTRASRAGKPGDVPDWKAMRDRWERSHLLRAVAAMLAFVLLITAVAI